MNTVCRLIHWTLTLMLLLLLMMMMMTSAVISTMRWPL